MVLGKLDSYMQKMKLENFQTPYTKINSLFLMGAFSHYI